MRKVITAKDFRVLSGWPVATGEFVWLVFNLDDASWLGVREFAYEQPFPFQASKTVVPVVSPHLGTVAHLL